jgi:hypothetical protein
MLRKLLALVCVTSAAFGLHIGRLRLFFCGMKERSSIPVLLLSRRTSPEVRFFL